MMSTYKSLGAHDSQWSAVRVLAVNLLPERAALSCNHQNNRPENKKTQQERNVGEA